MNYDAKENVKRIQARLNELAFGPLVVDGDKGPRTDLAIVAFKKSIGLAARPFVGPLTWDALMKVAPTVAGLPWIDEALKVLGLHEVRDYSKIKKWFTGVVSWIDPREIPWCGAFEATIYRSVWPDIQLPENPLGAKNWAQFGVPCTPQFGATLTFNRGKPSDWRGHVCNYLGESATAYRVIGANQSDAVTEAWIAKSRLHSSRWPEGFPLSNRIIHLSSSGAKLSENEA